MTDAILQPFCLSEGISEEQPSPHCQDEIQEESEELCQLLPEPNDPVYNCNEDVAVATFISGLQVTNPFTNIQ